MTNKKANLNTRESTITLPSKGGWFYYNTTNPNKLRLKGRSLSGIHEHER